MTAGGRTNEPVDSATPERARVEADDSDGADVVGQAAQGDVQPGEEEAGEAP